MTVLCAKAALERAILVGTFVPHYPQRMRPFTMALNSSSEVGSIIAVSHTQKAGFSV